MRTRGKLEQDYYYGTHDGSTIFDTVSSGRVDNAAHLVACWNAIESIGGDPETVGELVEALKKALIVGGTEHPYAFNMCYWCSSAEDNPHEDDCTYIKARALLAKIKA